MLSNVERGKQSVAPGGSTTYCMGRCLDFLGLSSGLDVRLRLQRKGGQFLDRISARDRDVLISKLWDELSTLYHPRPLDYISEKIQRSCLLRGIFSRHHN